VLHQRGIIEHQRGEQSNLSLGLGGLTVDYQEMIKEEKGEKVDFGLSVFIKTTKSISFSFLSFRLSWVDTALVFSGLLFQMSSGRCGTPF